MERANRQSYQFRLQRLLHGLRIFRRIEVDRFFCRRFRKRSECHGESCSDWKLHTFRNRHLQNSAAAGCFGYGYHTDSSDWGQDFLAELKKVRPDNFVIPVNYGTLNNNHENTYGRLDQLADALDSVLTLQAEIPIGADWAFTRYDVVGHSQGGVLLRMLCQTNLLGAPAFATPPATPVVSEENLYRGRFRRVITIGSPQNGSVIVHYLNQMRQVSPNPFIGQLAPFVPWLVDSQAPGGNKFDPFGQQIQEINNPIYPVDKRIKFHCIRTTLFFGEPPGPANPPICYAALGLVENQGGVLLPRGSDGVVDFDSQGGGSGTPGTTFTNSRALPDNIAHIDKPAWFFGVSGGQGQPTSTQVADKVIALLNGPTNNFGAFQVPVPLPQTEEAVIDALVPQVPIGKI